MKFHALSQALARTQEVWLLELWCPVSHHDATVFEVRVRAGTKTSATCRILTTALELSRSDTRYHTLSRINALQNVSDIRYADSHCSQCKVSVFTLSVVLLLGHAIEAM